MGNVWWGECHGINIALTPLARSPTPYVSTKYILVNTACSQINSFVSRINGNTSMEGLGGAKERLYIYVVNKKII